MLQAIENMQESVLTTVLEAIDKLNPKAFNELDKVYGTVLETMLEAIGKIQMNVHVDGANYARSPHVKTVPSLATVKSTPPAKQTTSLAYSPAKSETRTSSESRISRQQTTPAASSPGKFDFAAKPCVESKPASPAPRRAMSPGSPRSRVASPPRGLNNKERIFSTPVRKSYS